MGLSPRSGRSFLRKPLEAAVGMGKRARRVVNQARVRNIVVYANLAELGRRYGPAPGLAGFELKVFSQNGEDGVLAEIFHRVGVESRFFVEFGAGAGNESNAVLLADVYGWSGVFLEGDASEFASLRYKYLRMDKVRARQAMVTAENIQAILAECGVPVMFDLLCIDIDSNDYWVWQAIDSYRPRVVVCEYNGALDPSVAATQPYAPEVPWDGTEFFGASLKALEDLGSVKGYTLVHTDLTGTNAFFVLDELADAFTDCFPVSARRSVPDFTDFRHRPDHAARAYQTPEPGTER